MPTFTSRPRLVRLLALLARGQGLFYLAAGLWPLVHLHSFQTLTRATVDPWLVYAVGGVVAAVGAVLLLAARRRSFPREVILLAAGTAAGLAAIDVVTVSQGVIDHILLFDAAVEVGLVLGWSAARMPRTHPGCHDRNPIIRRTPH